MVLTNLSVVPEPTLLDVSRFENPSLHFPQSQSILTTAKPDVTKDIGDLIDHRAPKFVQQYLHSWEHAGIFSTLRSCLEEDPQQQPTTIQLPILRFAQEAQYRLAQISLYLQFVKRIHLLKIERKKFPNPEWQKGQRVDSLASNLFMREIYHDWDSIDDKLQAERRLRFRRDNRQARKWLLAASRLSFGVLIICGSTLEKRLTKQSTEGQTLLAAVQITQDFPAVVETYRLLDATVKGLLNQEKGITAINTEFLLGQLRHHLLYPQGITTTSCEFSLPPSETNVPTSPTSFNLDLAATAMEEIMGSGNST